MAAQACAALEIPTGWGAGRARPRSLVVVAGGRDASYRRLKWCARATCGRMRAVPGSHSDMPLRATPPAAWRRSISLNRTAAAVPTALPACAGKRCPSCSWPGSNARVFHGAFARCDKNSAQQFDSASRADCQGWGGHLRNRLQHHRGGRRGQRGGGAVGGGFAARGGQLDRAPAAGGAASAARTGILPQPSLLLAGGAAARACSTTLQN